MSAPPQVDPAATTQKHVSLRGRRIRIVLAIFFALLLAVFLPPYINVNRFQRRITASISQSLGRPVHLDHVTLNLLPVPGFTLERFVVAEDPAFGAEPTIRANQVRATLRVSSLWRRPIEFSTISFTDPSINLVHLADGRWNLDSILLQAARIDTAPTAQQTAGRAPRFPYIEATGARINLKLDQVKTPFSLTEADLALWLPSPRTWHLRMSARPARTDVPSGVPGIFRLDGTLGRAATLATIPLDLHADWRDAPVGEVSRLFLGRDAGLRGEMTLTASILGTVGNNELHTRVRIAGIRRDAFVPQRPLILDAACAATIGNAFHTIAAARCDLPPGAPPTLSFSGSLDDIRRSAPATLNGTLAPTPASALVPMLQTLSLRTPPALALDGTLSGSLAYNVPVGQQPTLQARFVLQDGRLAAGAQKEVPLFFDEVVLRSGEDPPVTQRKRRRGRKVPAPEAPDDGSPTAHAPLFLLSTAVDLGGDERTGIAGSLDRQGYGIHLKGPATVERLRALAAAFPQLAEGLAEAVPALPLPSATSVSGTHGPESLDPAGSSVVSLDLTVTRRWYGTQVWQAAPPPSSTTAGFHRAASKRHVKSKRGQG